MGLRLIPYMLAAARRLLLVLPICLCLAPSARSEKAAYALDDATGLFWQVEIIGDDGLTSASDSIDFPCCGDNSAQVFGDTLGSVDPIFTPRRLTHLLQPAPQALMVGVNPLTLDLSGSLSWNPPSGPSLMNGQSGPMDTGPLTEAFFAGTLATPFGSAPFGRSLLQHVGGDTTLRRFFGGADQAPPRLRLSSVAELLDSLEIDEDDVLGRIEMRNPYEAVLVVSSNIAELGAVTHALGGATGLFWEITITADDGAPSSDTIFAFSGADAWVDGETVGIVDPLFTAETLTHSIAESGLALMVGQQAVTLDLSGALEWSPSAPALQSGQAAAMPTGDASDASFAGNLLTPFGSVPFNVGLANHLGGDMTLANLSQAGDPPPWLRVSSTLDPLDTLEIDEGDVAGRVDMKNPYRAVLGTTMGPSGLVMWSLSIRVFFNDAFHDLLMSPPNGALRSVSWTLRSEILFNDVFYQSDPSLLPASVPALPQAGRLLLAALLLGVGLVAHRHRRN